MFPLDIDHYAEQTLNNSVFSGFKALRNGKKHFQIDGQILQVVG